MKAPKADWLEIPRGFRVFQSETSARTIDETNSALSELRWGRLDPAQAKNPGQVDALMKEGEIALCMYFEGSGSRGVFALGTPAAFREFLTEALAKLWEVEA